MGSAAKGLIGIVLEVTPNIDGIVPLLANTAITATINGYAQPTGATGMRIEATILGNMATGTVTIAGTNPAGSVISEVSNTAPVALIGQNPEVTAFKYCTVAVFATITSVTTSGFASGGLIRLGGIQAEKTLLPATFKYDDNRDQYSPNEQTGLPARHTRIVQLLLDEGWEVAMAIYPESSLFVAYELFGPPTNILPIAPSSTVVLKASAALSGGTITLTNPVGPGTQLQFVVTGSSVVGTFVVVGTNFAGAAISETVSASGTNGNGTYVTTNLYWTITSITYTGLTSGSAAVNGIGTPNLLTSTSVATSMTLTTGPTLPGMALVFEITGAGAGGTITVQGTTSKSNGLQTVIEVLSPSGNGTYYTQNVFYSVNNGVANTFATTGLTGGKISVYGIFAWQYFFNDITNADLFYTSAPAFYSGTDTRVYPGSYIEEADIELDLKSEMKLDAKGKSQDGIPVGDRTTSPMTGSRLSTLAQPPDLPIVGWQSLAWLDPQYTAPQSTGQGTNAYGTLLTCKVSCKVPKEPVYYSGQNQRWATVYYKKDGREFSFEATVDFKDLAQYENFRKQQKQTLSIGVLGPVVGMVGNFLYQKSWYFNMPFKFDKDGVKAESDPSKANVTASYKGMCEYAPEFGYSLQLVIINQVPPGYNS